MDSERKIYTRTGDQGETSLLGGTRILKSHPQVEAYGTLDELNSFIGLIRDQDIDEHYRMVLLRIQENLFIAEAWVAADPGKSHEHLPEYSGDIILELEKEIDEMNKVLENLVHFILPGGETAVSYCHIARTVCRRAERSVIRLEVHSQEYEMVIRFLNRLSDYLFVLARKIAKDKGVKEILWIP